MKRREGRVHSDDQSEQESDFFELEDSGESVLSAVCARELISMLSQELLPHERAVLHCLADGLGPREIGRRLNISHTMVIKHRCKIASLLSRLDHAPDLAGDFRKALRGLDRGRGGVRANGLHLDVIL